MDTAQDQRAAVTVAERIVAALSRPFSLSAGAVRVSASVGIAHCPAVPAERAAALDGSRAVVPLEGPRPDASTLLNRADAAMYAAKQGGKGRYAVWPAGAGGLVPAPARPPAVHRKLNAVHLRDSGRRIVGKPKYDFLD